MGKSAQTPAPVDYDKLIPLQTQANKDIFDYSLGQSRVNTVTPYGSTAWTKQTGAPDQQAYADALKAWQAKQTPGAGGREWVPGNDGIVGYDTNGPVYGGAASEGYWRTTPGAPGGGGAAPRLEDFAPTTWTQTQTLSPEQQKLFDAENASRLGLSELTGALTDRAQQGLAKPPDLSGIPQFQTSFANADVAPYLKQLAGTGVDLSQQVAGLQRMDPYAINQKLADALYSQGSRYLTDRTRQDTSALEARLAEQGFVPGTPGFTTEMGNLRKTQDMAFGDLADRAMIGGQQSGAQIYNNMRGNLSDQASILLNQASGNRASINDQIAALMSGQANTRANAASANSGIQQQIARVLQEYNLPLATLNAVRTGAQPTIQNSGLQQTSVPGLSAVDLLGADQARYGQELDLYNAKVGQQNALMDVLGRIAGAWVGRP